MVDNSVLRGGSGLKVTTGGPRSVQNKLSMRCNVPQYHQTYPVPHAKLTRMEEMAPGRRRQLCYPEHALDWVGKEAQ